VVIYIRADAGEVIMNILVIGDQRRSDELLVKIPAGVNVQHAESISNLPDSRFDLVFDLNFDERSDRGFIQTTKANAIVVSAVKQSLAQMQALHALPQHVPVIGMNCLPTFINRPLAEISFAGSSQQAETIFKSLNWSWKQVDDRVGMVSPRVLCMIINEACFTLQEGTASITDIDIAMKLGTNYPYGPFEWCDRIGVKDVYETLLAVYNDTHDSRYRCSALLKSKYLKREAFLN
jgi:3-hydroxybutyryl-CoA dehydrogenase